MSNIVIRRAVIDDLPSIVEVGQLFLREASGPYHITHPDPVAMTNMLLSVIQSSQSFIAIAVGDGKIIGGICMIIMPMWFAPHIFIAKEEFWYIRPDARGGSTAIRLLAFAEKLALNTGAHRIVMTSIADLRGESVTKMLLRRGYSLVEHLYVKKYEE